MWSIRHLYMCHCARLHISPTIYWLSTDQNDTIGRKSAILRSIKIGKFCESALNDRLCSAVSSWLDFVYELIWCLVSTCSPTLCVEINFVGLASKKCSQSTFPGGAQTFRCIMACMVWSPFLETRNIFGVWTINRHDR